MSSKIHVGIGDLGKTNRLFWTPPLNTTIRAKLLVDVNHIVSGDFCSAIVGGKEIIWAHTGDDDPGALINIPPRFSVIVPVNLRIGDGERQFKYLRGPKQLFNALMRINNGVPSLRGLIIDLMVTEGEFRTYDVRSTGKIARCTEDQDELTRHLMSQINDATAEQITQLLLEADPNIFNSSSKSGPKRPASDKKSSKTTTTTVEYVEEDL